MTVSPPFGVAQEGRVWPQARHSHKTNGANSARGCGHSSDLTGVTGNSSGLVKGEAGGLRAEMVIAAFGAGSAAQPAAGTWLGQDSGYMRINLNSWDILKIIIDVELHLLVVWELCALSFFTQGLEACF